MRNTDDAHETKKNTVRRERTQLTDWLAVGCVQNDRVNSHTKRKAEEKKNKQKNNLKTLIIVFESYSAIDKSRLVVVCVLNTLTYVARAISCLDIDIALGYFISHTHIQIYFEYMLTARRIRSGRWRFAYIVTVTAVREKYSNISNGMRIGMSVCVCCAVHFSYVTVTWANWVGQWVWPFRRARNQTIYFIYNESSSGARPTAPSRNSHRLFVFLGAYYASANFHISKRHYIFAWLTNNNNQKLFSNLIMQMAFRRHSAAVVVVVVWYSWRVNVSAACCRLFNARNRTQRAFSRCSTHFEAWNMHVTNALACGSLKFSADGQQWKRLHVRWSCINMVCAHVSSLHFISVVCNHYRVE